MRGANIYWQDNNNSRFICKAKPKCLGLQGGRRLREMTLFCLLTATCAEGGPFKHRVLQPKAQPLPGSSKHR